MLKSCMAISNYNPGCWFAAILHPKSEEVLLASFQQFLDPLVPTPNEPHSPPSPATEQAGFVRPRCLRLGLQKRLFLEAHADLFTVVGQRFCHPEHLGTLSPDPWDFRFSRQDCKDERELRGILLQSRPLNQRSSCIPALLYPPSSPLVSLSWSPHAGTRCLATGTRPRVSFCERTPFGFSRRESRLIPYCWRLRSSKNNSIRSEIALTYCCRGVLGSGCLA